MHIYIARKVIITYNLHIFRSSELHTEVELLSKAMVATSRHVYFLRYDLFGCNKSLTIINTNTNMI